MKIKFFSFMFAVIFVTTTAVEAGFLDRLKDNAKQALSQTVNDYANQNQAVQTTKQQVQQVQQTVDHYSAPQTTAANLPTQSPKQAWNETATFSDDSARMMQLFEAPAESRSVLDMPIKGITLGMPLRIADKKLKEAGFGYVSYQDQYVMEVRNVNGQMGNYTQDEVSKLGVNQGELVARYMMKIYAKEVSDEIISEMDPARQAMIQEARQMILEKNQTQTMNEPIQDRRMMDRQARMARRSTDRFSNAPLQLIYHFEFRQIYYGDQRFDHQAALQKARENFGVPSYSGASIGRRGVAYQTSDEHQLVYADVLLTPASVRESLVQSAVPEQHYVIKLALSHPQSGILRRTTQRGHPESAYPGNLEKQLELARLQNAPFMLVTHDTAKGMKIVQGWDYLVAGDTVREHFAEKQQLQQQPFAQVSF